MTSPTSPPAYPFRYPGFLCQPRTIATIFLVTVALIGLLRFVAADRESMILLRIPKEQLKDPRFPKEQFQVPFSPFSPPPEFGATCGMSVTDRFCMLHDKFPILQEQIHRKPLIQLVGFLLPIGIFFGRYSHMHIRYILRPYILLSGAHLAGFIISNALLGPGATVIYSFLFSLLRVIQIFQLLRLPEPSDWVQLGFPVNAGRPLASRTRSFLRSMAVAFTELLRRPWSIAMLLFIELLLWAANASLLGWHLVNVLRGLIPLIAEA